MMATRFVKIIFSTIVGPMNVFVKNSKNILDGSLLYQ